MYWSYCVGVCEKNCGWCFDYIFVSRRLADFIVDAYALFDVFGSDYCFVGLCVVLF